MRHIVTLPTVDAEEEYGSKALLVLIDLVSFGLSTLSKGRFLSSYP